ncbi:MAG: hypothetical protein ACK4NA_14115 [Alphaproteobacteria bacterium]
MSSVTRTCLSLSTLAVLGIAAGAIAAPQPGRWTGQIETGTSNRIAVTLTIQDGQRGSLLFGAPASCDVPLTIVGEQNGATLYSMEPNRSSGVFCDMQTGGQAQLRPDGNGGFLLVMAAGQRNAHYAGRLTPAR